MSKYNKGDRFIIEVKEVMESKNGTLYRGNFSTLAFDENGLDKLQKYDKYAENLERNHEVLKIFEEKYNKGLQDAWELIRKLASYNTEIRKAIFDTPKAFSMNWIMDNYTPQEALAKLEAYEKEQAEIKVGDVVKCGGIKGIVTAKSFLSDEEVVNILKDDGLIAINYSLDSCIKTGKHIDIAGILAEIGKE